MSSHAITYWKFIDQNLTCLCDPRTNLTRQIEWTNFSKKGTLWNGAEPDNYNFAIFDQQPHDLEFVKDQVFYKINETFRRNKITGWMNLYYIPEQEQQVQFRRAILKIQPQAFWYNPRAPLMRPKRTLLERENCYKERSATNFTTEERLWQMGYFENLERKYFDGDEKFINVVGNPRGAVLNYQPEVDSIVDYYEE